MRPPERPAELLDGPFTSAQARAAGLTARQLRSACWTRVFHGVYVAAELPVDLRVRAAALRLLLPADAVVGYTAAAWLHGADVRSHPAAAVEVIGQRGDQLRVAGTRASSALLEPHDVTEVHGVRVTTPVRTAFDLARRPNLVESVVGVDAMLNRGGCGFDELSDYIGAHPGWRGIRRARTVLGHAEPLAESPMESRQRMRLVLAGLPRPRAQVPIADTDGWIFAYIDNGYDRWRVGVDYDGGVHEGRWRRDLERQERIRDRGWWHRRYSALHIGGGWPQMVNQVGAALRAAGWPG